MNLILLETHEIQPGGQVVLNDGRATHILRVLKGQPGQILRVGEVNGRLGRGTIESIQGEQVSLRCELDTEPALETPVDLILALPRPKIMKRLWAPLASLGVRRIFLTTAAKVERNYFDTHWLEPEHYRPLLIEGLAQAADTRLPEVVIVRRLKPFIEDALDSRAPSSQRLLAHPGAPLLHLLRPMPPTPNRSTVLAIGPEGGWTDFELKLFDAHGFTRISTGSRILRTDIACVALLTLLRQSQ